MAKKTLTKKAPAKKTTVKKTSIKKVKKTPKKITKIVKKIVPKTITKKKAVKEIVKKKTSPVIKTTPTSKTKKTVKTPKQKVIKKVVMKEPKQTKVVKKIESIEVPKTKPITKIKGYGKEDLAHFRKIILEKRDEIIEQLQNLKEQMLDPTTGEYINENSPYSLHMAEQGTDAMEREKTFLYAQRENKFLGYLDDALKRIDAGTYGICLECIEEPQHLCDTCPLVPKARLEAVPHSQLCLPIKQKQEKK